MYITIARCYFNYPLLNESLYIQVRLQVVEILGILLLKLGEAFENKKGSIFSFGRECHSIATFTVKHGDHKTGKCTCSQPSSGTPRWFHPLRTY